MESINNFGSGMDKDTNPLNLQKGKYIDAQNIRILNDVGSTSFSINNIKGNEFNIQIPDIPAFQKIEIIGAGVQTSLTINGQAGVSFNTTGMTPETLYNYISTDLAYTKLNTEYKIYVGNAYLLIVPQLGFETSLTISQVGGFLLINSVTTPTYYIPVQTDLTIIGSVNIRDDIYLYTTNNTTQNPGGHNSTLSIDPSSVGQIWKYTYDKITLVGSLTLIYNNYIDFSTYYNIAPTSTTGRYENSGTQRIYWTDNYNQLRTLNVIDPNTLAISPSELGIIPAVNFDIPRLTTIFNTGGSLLKIGTYQCAYRLTNLGGAVTNFSNPSNIVNVVGADEKVNTSGNNFKDYIGQALGNTTNKQITWTIPNIDRNFDRIQIVIIFRERLTDPATILQVADLSISSDDLVFNLNGIIGALPITLEEFNLLSGTFTHCKTIGTKDNRLFVGNTRNELSDIDFDTRAYRWKALNDLDLTNNGIASNYTTMPTVTNLPENSDAINVDQSINRYKQDGVTLGGEGINISYEFYTTDIAADLGDPIIDFSIPDLSSSTWRHTNPRFFGNTDTYTLDVNSIDNNGNTEKQTYPLPIPNLNDGFKYPHITGLYKGYQRNEIYRFGIQFYDKAKNPMFVKWIGDIKMPDFEDVNPNRYYEDNTYTQPPHNDFRLSHTINIGGQLLCFIRSLGIQFTINNLENISNQIDGYSIVRIERSIGDKTIVAQGYIKPVDIFRDAPADPFQIFTTVANASQRDGNEPFGYAPNTLYNQRGFFITPELCNLQITPTVGMNLRLVSRLSSANTDIDTVVQDSGAINRTMGVYKMYNWNTLVSPFNEIIDQIDFLNYNGLTTDNSSGEIVNNYDYNVTTTDSAGLGSPCFYFKITPPNAITQWPLTGGGQLLANIERTVNGQYGGNTYAARAANIYISCSHFRPIKTTTLSISDTFEVFSGDTYVNMYDSLRWSFNYGKFFSRGVAAAAKYSTIFYLPIESSINTDLRHGHYWNKDVSNPLVGGSTYETNSDEFVETYDYNTIYSSEDNIKQYFPKPDPFISITEFDNRFYASEIKINGEFVDSWGLFKANNYWDVEGTYGPINAMQILKDKMYFWQDRSFGALEINPRAIVTDINNIGTNNQLQLGTGNILQRHDYISTEYGLQHQNGLTHSSNGLYWIDVNNRKFFDYKSGQSLTPESDIKGLFSFFNNKLFGEINNIDKPTYLGAQGVNGIRAIFDYKYNQAIFTITDNFPGGGGYNSNFYTLAFDENLNSFTSFYGYTPLVYFSDGYRIFSEAPLTGDRGRIFMHDIGEYCKFYGNIYNSSIKLVVNDNPQYTKAFDNIMYDSQTTDIAGINFNDDTWNTIRVYNDYQNTNFQSLILGDNIKRKERTWQLHIPRNRVLYTSSNSPNIFTDLDFTGDKPMGERIRDKYITVDLTYNNLTNRNLSCNNFRTIYRGSPR